MTKIAHVIIVLKFGCESKRVIIPGEAIHFFFVVILKVVNILTRSMPADVLFRLTFIRKSVYPHSVIIERISLG